jgi:hypothetical protein
MATWNGTNNDLQNTTQKAKDRATRTPLKTEGELRCSGRVSSSSSISGTRRDTPVLFYIIHVMSLDAL